MRSIVLVLSAVALSALACESPTPSTSSIQCLQRCIRNATHHLVPSIRKRAARAAGSPFIEHFSGETTTPEFEEVSTSTVDYEGNTIPHSIRDSCERGMDFIKCQEQCPQSDVRDFFIRQLNAAKNEVCTERHNYEAGKMWAATKCVMKDAQINPYNVLLRAAYQALTFAGGNSSVDVGENLCDVFLSFARLVTANLEHCDYQGREAAMEAIEGVYRMVQFQLGMENSPSRCKDFRNYVEDGVSIYHLMLAERTTAPPQTQRSDPSAECLQHCLQSASLYDVVEISRNPCLHAKLVANCWNNCPRNRLAHVAQRAFNDLCSSEDESMSNVGRCAASIDNIDQVQMENFVLLDDIKNSPEKNLCRISRLLSMPLHQAPSDNVCKAVISKGANIIELLQRFIRLKLGMPETIRCARY